MDNPEISLIMAVYNSQEYLVQAINSILDQSFSNFEFIIVNDGSTDDSQKIIDYYSDKDQRIIQIKNIENCGLTKSLNLGINIAQGTFIARMDADDISLPTRFEKQIKFLESHDEIGLLGSNGYYIDERSRRLNPLRHFENDLEIRWGSLFNAQFIHSSIMFRHSLLPLAGLYQEIFKYGQDYEFCSRLLNYTKGANLHEPLILWRKSSGNISTLKKAEQRQTSNKIAINNIKQLFGNEFVQNHDEMLVFRALYQGIFSEAGEEQISRFLQILEKFKLSHKMSRVNLQQLNTIVAARIFESIYRKGFNKKNIKYLAKIIQLSPNAIWIGIKKLCKNLINKVIKRLKRNH